MKRRPEKEGKGTFDPLLLPPSFSEPVSMSATIEYGIRHIPALFFLLAGNRKRE